jgi:uncharacterized protein with FMN-binding domain
MRHKQSGQQRGIASISLWVSLSLAACLLIARCSRQNEMGQIQSSEITSLEATMTPVPWLSPVETADEGFRVYRSAYASETSMKKSVGRLLYAVENHSESEHFLPYLLELSHKLVELHEDRAAIFWINRLEKHPRSKGYHARSHWMNEIDCAQKKGQYLRLKVYARNDLTKESADLIKTIEPTIPKEYLMIAEAYAVMGNKESALEALHHCVTSGVHLPYDGASDDPHNPGWIMNQSAVTRASAAVLAWGLGNLNLAKQIAEPVIGDEKLKTHTWASRRVSWRVLNDIYQQEGTLRFSGLKDGTYTGTGMGFVDAVEVSVTIENGFPAQVQVSRHEENRPYNSIEAMPERLNAYHGVADAVSGATVSSSAITMAMYEALLKSGDGP